jgi:hypothetical protein
MTTKISEPEGKDVKKEEFPMFLMEELREKLKCPEIHT